MDKFNNVSLVYDIDNRRYLNITGRCTLSCQFCPKQQGSTELHNYHLGLKLTPKADDILPLLGDVSQYEEYVFCGYGEPTLNLSTLLTLAHTIKKQGGTVRVNTDGLGNLFHRRNILPELAKCVDSLSISLNADTEDAYLLHCQPKLKGSYQALRQFIELAPKYIQQVYVSAIDGLAGVKISACREFVEQNNCIFKHRTLGNVG